eukprot:351402-Chlamydomonas_euryale.AAC.5
MPKTSHAHAWRCGWSCSEGLFGGSGGVWGERRAACRRRRTLIHGVVAGHDRRMTLGFRV